MRALVVRQPFASQIASGEKTTEYRSWPTHHRGPLLIVAGTHGSAKDGLPRGVAVCVVDVVRCRPSTLRRHRLPGTRVYHWELSAPRPVGRVPVKGRLGLFDVEFAEATAAE